MPDLKLVLTVLLCGTAFASCYFWIKSATVTVPVAEDDGWTGVLLSKDGKKGPVDVLATAEAQTRWNKWAAAFAAVAAVCQAALSWITY
jgi:hypothetical protein